MIKDYLFDISRIVEAASELDQIKVAAYVNQICDHLEADGETEAASRLRKIVGRGKVTKLSLAKLGDKTANTLARALPVDSESRLTTATEEMIGKGEIKMFLSSPAERTLVQFMTYFRATEKLVANRVAVSPSMLLYGPPGCGKTQLAKYIAAELELPLITARVDGLVSSYLGSTAKNLRALFEHATSRPCVFFLDEFDALAKMRDDTRELGELKRVVISLLQNIDAMGVDHVLLAATNHQHLLDQAIWRRFAYKLNLNEPDIETRTRMFALFLGSFANDELVTILAKLSDGLSGAMVRFVAEECIRKTIISNSVGVSLANAVEVAMPINVRTAESADGSTSQK